ncbi:Os06g0174700 [Oryza sativa Japonica Group]|uniref:Os06g0174700 protein n=2 Tax=Oryza sativa subsp. japonica TaxID=39947 RepID=A0A0P0WT05_ORYSJ|nr:hypothetical protein EE612_032222 [Oryza sativa]BAD44808.1 unknown protein [Oryza sativa Japonica Group]BAF18861.1 Os06g0174700 [Oryza sativa Japonica Group]BAS96405.1 Os06g0174700 [Oryza sativa Japonica Group]|eukprot:NP_001056947.1 Os06g0174700 [Oryza sativa Japonica Group]
MAWSSCRAAFQSAESPSCLSGTCAAKPGGGEHMPEADHDHEPPCGAGGVGVGDGGGLFSSASNPLFFPDNGDHHGMSLSGSVFTFCALNSPEKGNLPLARAGRGGGGCGGAAPARLEENTAARLLSQRYVLRSTAAPPCKCRSFPANSISSPLSTGSAVELLDGGGPPHRTWHGHGDGDDTKKKPPFHPLSLGNPVKSTPSAPAPRLPRKWYQPFSLDKNSLKKRRNTASDGGAAAWWESRRNPATTRHPLGVIWLGATPRWRRSSQAKGCSGRRIPASSARAYTHAAPGGGAEHARRSPAGRAANSARTPYFLQTASTASCVRRDEAMWSATDLGNGESAAAASARRWSGSVERERKASASMISTEDDGEEEEECIVFCASFLSPSSNGAFTPVSLSKIFTSYQNI